MQICIDPRQSVAEILLENPSRATVFEQLRIDYCCGGKQSLLEACAHRGLPVADVVERLNSTAAALTDVPVDAWAERPAADLVAHIVETHHAFVRAELPRLRELSIKVARVHGHRAPETLDLADVIRRMADELESHLGKEEQILFPFIVALEKGSGTPFPTIGAPISCMEHEHSDAGEALEQIRRLTDNHTPPLDACNTWRVLYHTLAAFERDLHQHIHKENNILFPRALRLEQEQKRA